MKIIAIVLNIVKYATGLVQIIQNVISNGNS